MTNHPRPEAASTGLSREQASYDPRLVSSPGELPLEPVADESGFKSLHDDPRLEALTGDIGHRTRAEGDTAPEGAVDASALLEADGPRTRRLQLLALASVLGVLVLVAGVRSFVGRAVAAPMPSVSQIAAGVMNQPQSNPRTSTAVSDAMNDVRPAGASADSSSASDAGTSPASVAHSRSARGDSLATPFRLAPGVTPNPMSIRGTMVTPTVRGKPRALAVGPIDAQVGEGCSAGQTRVALNTATLAQLDSLPGVGPVLAARILTWRTRHRGFSDVHELQEVPGIGPSKFAKLRPRVTL